MSLPPRSPEKPRTQEEPGRNHDEKDSQTKCHPSPERMSAVRMGTATLGESKGHDSVWPAGGDHRTSNGGDFRHPGGSDIPAALAPTQVAAIHTEVYL